MEEYLHYELSELIDILAERTATYTQMMSDGFQNGEEFAHIGEQILTIQKTIWIKMGCEDDAGMDLPEAGK